MNKNVLVLGIVVLLIVGGIYYIEGGKVSPSADSSEIINPITPTSEIPDASFEIGNETKAETLNTGLSDSVALNTFLPAEKYIPDEDKISKSTYQLAPELVGISGYINSEPFTLEQLRGKVVIVDFWTYSCINCIRTQPYLNAWYDAYADKGLVIVGVHTPEFDFEKDYDNVKNSVEKENLKYPVVQDNDYKTWRAFKNRFWPRKYILDIDGLIRYDHAGEGAYEQTESIIKQLLAERNDKLGMDFDLSETNMPEDIFDVDFRQIGSPEVYFGYKFARGNLGSIEGFNPEKVTSYAVPENVVSNKAYLVGNWLNTADYSELIDGTGKVFMIYSSKSVNIVASSEQEVDLNLLLDNLEIADSDIGYSGKVISEEKLYNIVETGEYGQHTLEIQISQPGFRIYTFTFG